MAAVLWICWTRSSGVAVPPSHREGPKVLLSWAQVILSSANQSAHISICIAKKNFTDFVSRFICFSDDLSSGEDMLSLPVSGEWITIATCVVLPLVVELVVVTPERLFTLNLPAAGCCPSCMSPTKLARNTLQLIIRRATPSEYWRPRFQNFIGGGTDYCDGGCAELVEQASFVL